MKENFLSKEIYDILAKLSFYSLGFSIPNPPVACVIFHAINKKILASGFTQKKGNDHAEVQAYNNFLSNQQHSIVVTLEPCSHFGKTPPCLDLLLKRKPKKLFYGLRDTNPLVKKKRSLSECRSNSIEVIQDKTVNAISKIFLSGFFCKLKYKRPSFLIKTVVSKENFFCSKKKVKIKISNMYSNYLSQFLRAKFDAVIVGPKTTLIDKPQLNFRGFDSILPEKFKIIKNHKLLESIIYCLSDKSFLDFHLKHKSDYQPYRVFIISNQAQLIQEFLDIQHNINQTYQMKKIIFFLYAQGSYTKNCIEKIKILSDNKVYFFNKEPANFILQKLSLFSCNQVMVEGGNFLYQEFSKIFSPYDTLLKIKSNKAMKELVNLSEGYKPNLEIKNKISVAASFFIENDLWEFYQCSQD